MKIEFFHDVICSFCFPLSYRMRQLKEDMPEVEIIHRSFALVKEETDFDGMFGSREAAKAEIMNHWRHANENDDLHRFNISGMEAKDFPFPSSMNGLLATKAADVVGGSEAYWDLFDALQAGLFVENKNIQEITEIEARVEAVGIDLAKWRAAFVAPETLAKVEQDLALVNQYGIRGAPSLVINGKYEINGAQTLATIKTRLAKIAEKERPVLETITLADETTAGGSCRMVDGKMECD